MNKILIINFLLFIISTIGYVLIGAENEILENITVLSLGLFILLLMTKIFSVIINTKRYMYIIIYLISFLLITSYFTRNMEGLGVIIIDNLVFIFSSLIFISIFKYIKSDKK